MKIRLPATAAVLGLTGCQPPAPEAVASSQQPPSTAVRQHFLKVARNAGVGPEDVGIAHISSVVLLDAKSKTYAFCVRATKNSDFRGGDYIGVSMRNGTILGSTVNDYRCHDKRLRYYRYPELEGAR